MSQTYREQVEECARLGSLGARFHRWLEAGGYGTIKAVTAIRKQKLVTIEGRGMLGVPGVAARAFGAVASTGTSVPLITQASSEQSICFSVPSVLVSRVSAALEEEFRLELQRRWPG